MDGQTDDSGGLTHHSIYVPVGRSVAVAVAVGRC